MVVVLGEGGGGKGAGGREGGVKDSLARVSSVSLPGINSRLVATIRL